MQWTPLEGVMFACWHLSPIVWATYRLYRHLQTRCLVGLFRLWEKTAALRPHVTTCCLKWVTLDLAQPQSDVNTGGTVSVSVTCHLLSDEQLGVSYLVVRPIGNMLNDPLANCHMTHWGSVTWPIEDMSHDTLNICHMTHWGPLGTGWTTQCRKTFQGPIARPSCESSKVLARD